MHFSLASASLDLMLWHSALYYLLLTGSDCLLWVTHSTKLTARTAHAFRCVCD